MAASAGGCSGNLQSVESAPRVADHAHFAGAPRLSGQPRDDLDAVAEFPGQIFARENTIRVATALEVDTHAGISACRYERMHHGIAGGGGVPPSVREVFEDRRDRFRCSVLGQPDLGGQPGPIGEGIQTGSSSWTGLSRCALAIWVVLSCAGGHAVPPRQVREAVPARVLSLRARGSGVRSRSDARHLWNRPCPAPSRSRTEVHRVGLVPVTKPHPSRGQ